jgi:hypothetical protein
MLAIKPTLHPWSRSRSIAVLGAGMAVACVAAVLAYMAIAPVAAVSTHVMVDTAAPSVVQRPVYPVSSLIQRAELWGRLVTSPSVTEQIARKAGVPPGQLAATAHTTARVADAFTEPGSEERASEIRGSDLPYRLEVESRPWNPVLDIYTQAPSVSTAMRLSDAAVTELESRLNSIADADQVSASDRLVLKQLGPPRGSVVNGGMSLAVALLTFLLVLAVTFAFLRILKRAAGVPPAPNAWQGNDAWPHTGRLMPWTFAGLLAVVWLVPFSDILLDVPTPIDLTFDRLILPVVAATWLLALMVGGRLAPRLRVTGIHLAVAAFVTCAFVSVLSNASELNQTLELQASVKQLPLLLSYICVFVIASTAVRRNETQAFLSYTLGLAVLCALGVIFEYRFKQNLFYDWSDKVLPAIFKIGTADSAAFDDIGRRVVRGPALVPLETVAMLAMALPIALVRLMHREDMRGRLMYGVAACLLFAAAFATFRKSALLAPISVLLTIAYFRRSELLKLAPLGLVLVIVIPVIAPGAVGMTTAQFDPSRLGVATVSDRASDYDAVRPDLWSHFLFGRGWGGYDHTANRILDSEMLRRLMEMGTIGLLSYVLMIASVVAACRPAIVNRDPTWASPALVSAAAAVSFGAASTLFDVMAFQHAVYVFLAMAGLGAATVAHYRDDCECTARRLAEKASAGAPTAGPQGVTDPRSATPALVRVGERSS